MFHMTSKQAPMYAQFNKLLIENFLKEGSNPQFHPTLRDFIDNSIVRRRKMESLSEFIANKIKSLKELQNCGFDPSLRQFPTKSLVAYRVSEPNVLTVG